MRSFFLTIVSMTFIFTSHAQVRVDSSFSFGANPAKKYSLYIPTNYNSTVANPLMVGFHPLDTSRWNAISWRDTLLNFSEMNNLILVCPDGDSDGNITDSVDYAFTTALIDSVNKWYNIDGNRVYTIGFSMGGKAVYEYGLNNAETFGGFIPVGPAIAGSSFVNNVIQNAALRPFYLVHGSNDSPNSRFYPMLTALFNNCAIVDSILMQGVGHTIDFPNRNSILTDAYKWVDSVNVTPRTASFSLITPPNLSSITSKGFHNYLHHFKWGKSPLTDTCGVLKYEVLIDLPNGNFSNPLLTLWSNNGGLDTVLSLSNHVIDSLLGSYSIPINSTLTLDWTVKSNILNKYADTAKSFRITMLRKKLGFSLVSPSNNNVVTLQNNGNKFFNWEDLKHYISVSYRLLFDDTTGDFSNPILSYESSNGGSSSSVNKEHERLYYDLMFHDGKKIGDTIVLNWKVLASDTILSEFSSNERRITFIRGNVGFKLFEPADSSIIASNKGIDYKFSWDSVLLSDIRYEFRFDTLGIDLQDTASFVIGSDNDSLFSQVAITYEILDSMMNFYNVNYLDTLYGQWTSRAIHDSSEEYSLNTYKVTIVRSHPVGISKINGQAEITLFPNPADNLVTMILEGRGIWNKIKIYNTQSSLVYEKILIPGEKTIIIEVADFSEGTYLWSLSGEGFNESGKLIISR